MLILLCVIICDAVEQRGENNQLFLTCPALLASSVPASAASAHHSDKLSLPWLILRTFVLGITQNQPQAALFQPGSELAPAVLRIRELERIDGTFHANHQHWMLHQRIWGSLNAHFPAASQMLPGTALKVRYTEEIPLLNSMKTRMQSWTPSGFGTTYGC